MNRKFRFSTRELILERFEDNLLYSATTLSQIIRRPSSDVSSVLNRMVKRKILVRVHSEVYTTWRYALYENRFLARLVMRIENLEHSRYE